MDITYDIDVARVPRYDPPVEFVERKGAGHPDTLCDTLAEGLARDLAAWYLERHGELRHFNVDKALLAAGQVRVGFGGGEVTGPSRLILAGKADVRDGHPPLGAMTRAAYDRLGRVLPWARLPGDYQVEIRLNPSSDDLLPLLERGARADGVPLANDTSFAVVSLPRSPLESAVHAVERALAEAAVQGRPPIGRDVKVMGSRRGNEVRLTVAAAAIASLVPDADAYRDVKRRVHGVAEETVRTAFADAGRVLGRLEVHVNEADLPPDGAYLTLTGSSAEAGDDGQVGRGNRVGGLITPHRPMSLEAACGKNPLGHVGKLYHAVAWDACEAILALDGVDGVTVRLLSRIGRPVDRPVAAQVEVAGEPDPETLREARRRLAAAVADWRGASQRLVEGRYELV